MQNYELIEVDRDPCFNGLPAYEKVVAVSISVSRLKDYCLDKYKEEVVENTKPPYMKTYYYIRPTKISII